MTEDPLGVYAPGTYGCHEALHMAMVISDMIDNYLIEHEAVRANPQWAQLALDASVAVDKLYQAIGQKHFPEVEQRD